MSRPRSPHVDKSFKQVSAPSLTATRTCREFAVLASVDPALARVGDHWLVLTAYRRRSRSVGGGG